MYFSLGYLQAKVHNFYESMSIKKSVHNFVSILSPIVKTGRWNDEIYSSIPGKGWLTWETSEPFASRGGALRSLRGEGDLNYFVTRGISAYYGGQKKLLMDRLHHCTIISSLYELCFDECFVNLSFRIFRRLTTNFLSSNSYDIIHACFVETTKDPSSNFSS